jgi:DNA-binding response OmpR family regulator
MQLPQLEGLAVCRELWGDTRTRELPIIMITTRGNETDPIVGLEMGADDYVVKPLSPKQLMARVHAVLRRSTRPAETADASARSRSTPRATRRVGRHGSCI